MLKLSGKLVPGKRHQIHDIGSGKLGMVVPLLLHNIAVGPGEQPRQ
jgi:hypothetical protein